MAQYMLTLMKKSYLWGKTTSTLDSAYCNLMSSNLQSKENYCKRVKLNFKQDKINKKVDKLYNKVKSGNYNKSAVVECYEQLDRQITGIMLGAEKKCRTPKETRHMWPIKLVTAARVARYWKTW
eukprot:687536-Ditylum_brightwellii.AAC.1